MRLKQALEGWGGRRRRGVGDCVWVLAIRCEESLVYCRCSGFFLPHVAQLVKAACIASHAYEGWKAMGLAIRGRLSGHGENITQALHR